MSCNYVQHPVIEDQQCSGVPAYKVMHRVDAPYWFETCEEHLTDAITEVMGKSNYVVVSEV